MKKKGFGIRIYNQNKCISHEVFSGQEPVNQNFKGGMLVHIVEQPGPIA